jgi:hypothetical protein
MSLQLSTLLVCRDIFQLEVRVDLSPLSKFIDEVTHVCDRATGKLLARVETKPPPDGSLSLMASYTSPMDQTVTLAYGGSASTKHGGGLMQLWTISPPQPPAHPVQVRLEAGGSRYPTPRNTRGDALSNDAHSDSSVSLSRPSHEAEAQYSRIPPGVQNPQEHEMWPGNAQHPRGP